MRRERRAAAAAGAAAEGPAPAERRRALRREAHAPVGLAPYLPISPHISPYLRRTLHSGWATLRQWEERMRDDILASAEVICSTLIGAGSESLGGRTFSHVVILI